MKDRLDKSDRHILRLLQENGRITNADLARKVGLSPPSMLQRVRKLEESGTILGYSAVLDQQKLGYSIVVMAMISLAMHQEKPIDQFLAEIKGIPEVLECYHVSGDYDFLLKIVAKDIADYERVLLTHVAGIKSVGKIHSCFVLKTNKSSTPLPV
ncbi:Lrp/AsnC family transcriptional regulator [Kamptonema cortianum]|nr:Lrp/AsnC family transcriptional regulator [Kamptonema cortianum]